MFRKNNNCILILAISAVLGIIVGVVAYNVTIPGITIALGITLAFTALILLLSTGIALKAKGNESDCLCNYSKCLALGIVGTIITGIIALSITIATASIAIAILLGLLTAFALTTLLSFVGLLLCIALKDCFVCPCNG